MRSVNLFAAATSAALFLAPSVQAQSALTGVDGVDEQIDQIGDSAREDLAKGRDAQRYGNLGVPQGWRGSVALTGSATSGNTDTRQLSTAGRLTYGQGLWSHSIGFGVTLGEANGTTDEKKVFGTYEATRAINASTYGFGTGRYQYDAFSSTKNDAFLGAGLGFRVINSAQQTWRVQAGLGGRYLEDQAGATTEEGAGIASSRYFYQINDGVSLTNDTDVLFSDTNTVATNDLGLNFRVSKGMSTRVSYRTEYNSAPAAGFEEFDNTLGLSLVMGF